MALMALMAEFDPRLADSSDDQRHLIVISWVVRVMASELLLVDL